MAYPVPEVWTVSGKIYKNGTPFFEANVYADNLKNGNFQQIAETGIAADGSFVLTFSRWNFQEGNNSIEYPTLRIRVVGYQGNVLCTSDVYGITSSTFNVGSIDILKPFDQESGNSEEETGKDVDPDAEGTKKDVDAPADKTDADCRVFGTVKNEQGNILSNLMVKAYCLHFEERISNSTISHVFNKIELGASVSNDEGRFEILYDSKKIPHGLLLDSKEDYGKDKASLYAEVFMNNKSLAIERLVFNGRTNQEINFSVKAEQQFFTNEFEKIDSLLNIYLDAVFTEYGGSNWNEKISAITLFLNSNTTFPLVAGRERLSESKVRAYFMAYSLYYQLQNKYVADANNEALSLGNKVYWCEAFYALSLHDNISTLSQLIKGKPALLQKTLLGAVSDGLICVDTNKFLELWQKLLGDGVASDNSESEETSLNINQMLLLYLSGNLSVVWQGQLLRYVSNISRDNISQYLTAEKASLFIKLQDAYYNAGANTDVLIRNLQKNALPKEMESQNSAQSISGNTFKIKNLVEYPRLTESQISKLETLFDLNDFFGKFADGVVCTYSYACTKADFEFERLADFIKLSEMDWGKIVDNIATNYGLQFGKPVTTVIDGQENLTYPPCLPSEFPGTNTELKKVIYVRKLFELIKTWFPQQALLLDLETRFGTSFKAACATKVVKDEEGNETTVKPDKNKVKLFRIWKATCKVLQNSDWDKFSLSNTDLDEFLETKNTDIGTGCKKRIQQLQRLFHLTDSASAIAYLIEEGFGSAYKISSMDEDFFVARYGNGIGKTEEARQIHRLAENYTAEATLNIQAYASDSSTENEDTLPSLPRAVPTKKALAAPKFAEATNVAKKRTATRDSVNWAKLFGKINYAKATEGQSILSASAYYVDLLKFLKKSSAYKAFTERRPDYLNLELTKANAEISMPTIDLGIELLESLVAGPVDEKSGFSYPKVNNNLFNVTAAQLRAEPCPFDENIEKSSLALLGDSVYPILLPTNFIREKAKKILANLSLHFYDISVNSQDCTRELRLDSKQKELISSEPLPEYPVWNLWGLNRTGNKILMPNKVDYATGDYLNVLSNLSVFLQRSGLTIQDLNVILSNPLFNQVQYKPRNSEYYQLANIDGYQFIARNSEFTEWDDFFKKIAVLLHRKNVLGWNLQDLLLTFNMTLEQLDVIYEMCSRYGTSVQEAVVMGKAKQFPIDKLNEIYQLASPIAETDVLSQRDFVKIAKTGFDIEKNEAIALYKYVMASGKEMSTAELMQEFYRTILLLKTFGISLETLIILKENKILDETISSETNSVQNEGLKKLRFFADEWRIITGTSIEADFYVKLMSPISEDEKNAAEAFALNLSGDAKENDLSSQENLTLLLSAEFGIAENFGDELISANEIQEWKQFVEKAKEYDNNLNIYEEKIKGKKETEKSGQVTKEGEGSVDDEDLILPELDQKSLALYVNMARKVAVYNYLQTYNQGIDLRNTDFVKFNESEKNISIIKYADNEENGSLKPLIRANYATDRLLSGDFNLDLLSNLMKNENEGDWEKLEDILAIDGDTIERLRDASFGMTASEYTDSLGWMKFAQAYELYSKTHSTLSELESLLNENDNNYGNIVKNFEQTIKNHTKESEWLKFAQEMNDDLRKKKRDALAAYVCFESCSNTERANRYPRLFVDESDIYSYYLMDVKMEPDMSISRIVQASASIQLFVQRAELGLEGDKVLNEQQRSEWEWMKNFRVWEAARKVFLYPENWIASDLRDDKTPFFEELEDRIQEFSDDHKNLEDALFEYLEKVREVSSIEIIGATKEDGGDEGGILYTLHIVGRTQGEPHTYYYRKYKAKATLAGEWTPWERIDIDIPSETVVPAIVNQRLYLLWPQISLGQRNIDSASEGGLESIEYYARIQICWTSYTGTKWTGTRMSINALFDASKNQLDFALGDNESIEDRYNLKTESSQEWVKVSIVKTHYHYQEYEEVVGSTEVMDGSSKTTKVTKRIYDYSRQFYHKVADVTIAADGLDTIDVCPGEEMLLDDCAPERSRLIHGVFIEEEKFTCGDKGLNYPENNAILNYTPGRFRIVSTNLSMLKLDDRDKTEDLPFFYMDGRRTFFVQSVPKDGNVNQTQKNYRFELISHSLVDEFYKRYRDGGIKWLYTRETQALPISDSYYYSYSYYNYYFSVYLGYYMAGDWQSWDLGQNIFRFNYRPDKKGVDGPYPAPMVDFVWGGANAMYNWELFFYVPTLIAEKMIAEQSYEEALLWLQLVFDPRMNYSAYEQTKRFIKDLPKGARYWKFLPFFANKDADKSILQMLGLPTKQDILPNRSALQSLVDKWKNDPFNPHLIAHYRNVAYQKYVVMRYLDTLIGWGDLEFAKDTTESVNLAVQFYLLAAELLGPKNVEAPEPEPVSPLTANDLLTKTDDLGNAFIEYENSALIGHDKAKVITARAMDAKARCTGNIVESMFYFAVPRNETLFSYWDTVADRLYKIRNSLNIDGVKRTLALFAPPIDPGMLVKARAMGISIDEILNSSTEMRSIYRFRVIVKLAVDMAKDACQMGRDLLAILEKQDAEQLQVFKAKCDKAVIAESRTVHEMEIKSLEAEKTQLEEKKIAKKNTSKKKKAMHLISTAEKKYQKLMEKVAKIQETVEKVRNIASATFKIPDFKFGAVTNMFGGPRFDMESLGGTKLAENLVSAAESYAARFAQRRLDAAKIKLQAELERRTKEWTIEDDIADAEVVEVEKQEVVNEIKTLQVEKKQKNIENEILRSEQVYDVLSEKFTNNDLYIWLERELGKVFKQYVNLLIDVAKMAEKAYHFEIPDDANKSYILSNYWDSFYKGLLAPERILLDLRRMEKAYLEKDEHRIIITKPIVLADTYKQSSDENSYSYQITDLSSLISADFTTLKNQRIHDLSLQIFSDAPIPPYVCLNAQIVLTGGLATGNSWASSMAQSKVDQIDIRFSRDQYFPFEGIDFDGVSLSIFISGIQNIKSNWNATLFVRYTAN